MKVSLPQGPERAVTLPPNADPHADADRVPRFSSPLSFLSKRAFFVALAFVGFMSGGGVFAQAPVTNTTCVCEYDANKDYFPIKLSPQFASKYQIEYFKSYKKITVQVPSGAPVVTYAYLCGTPRPSEAAVSNSIQIPIDTAVLTSTTFLPLINYIGRRSSLLYVAVAEAKMPACLRRLYTEGKVAGGTNMTAVAPEIIAKSLERSKQYPDIVFADNFDFQFNDIVGSVQRNFGTFTQAFRLPQSSEPTPLGALEWLEVVAALYNAEAEGNYVVSSIEQRYNCVKNLVANIPAANKVKVIWGNFYNNTDDSDLYTGFYLGSCPNYYCDLVRDAGGEFISATGISEADALELASQADVWIYPDGNFFAPTPTNKVFLTAERNLTFGNTTLFKNKRVFDFFGGHELDWFDTRLAEPDVILMDLVQAFYGSQFISEARPKRFLRNVFLEQPASQAPRDPNTCPDTEAPLYTGWLAGPCAVTGTGGEGLPATASLCPLKQGSASSVSASLGAIVAFLVAISASFL